MNESAQWEVLVIPIAVMIISQFIKTVLDYFRGGKWNWKELNSYGGMPSSHSAFLTSLLLMVGLREGFGTPLFAVTVCTAAIFIRDAVGIRRSLGHHARVLNHVLSEFLSKERRHFPDRLEERLGHTYAEVVVGMMTGAILTLGFTVLLI